ncbi:MAG: LamG domain-containing protein [Eubacteriales bacterium]
MKKLLILVLALVMLVALIAACGDESEKTEATTTAATTEATTTEATTTTTETTAATTTTEATTETTTTETTTTETTTTETTTPAVVVNVPEAYADIDFKDGTISDAKGQISFTNKGATVGKASVIHDGNTYEADALTASSGKYVICKFNNISTSAAMKAWAESGFSVEAFYLMPNSGSVQGIVCGTQNGGWGLAEDKTGKPYFITGGGSKYNSGAYAKSASSTTELVHVLGVYDMANKKCSIYINGKLAQEVTIASNFVCGEGNTFNYFCLGDDIKTGLTGGDFPTSGMTMVDAKIYDSALTADDAANVYKAAVNSLK